jgi:hypothetical protein
VGRGQSPRARRRRVRRARGARRDHAWAPRRGPHRRDPLEVARAGRGLLAASSRGACHRPEAAGGPPCHRSPSRQPMTRCRGETEMPSQFRIHRRPSTARNGAINDPRSPGVMWSARARQRPTCSIWPYTPGSSRRSSASSRRSASGPPLDPQPQDVRAEMASCGVFGVLVVASTFGYFLGRPQPPTAATRPRLREVPRWRVSGQFFTDLEAGRDWRTAEALTMTPPRGSLATRWFTGLVPAARATPPSSELTMIWSRWGRRATRASTRRMGRAPRAFSGRVCELPLADAGSITP